MSSHRTHHVTTADGVTIGGAVHGQGPPLVLLQGIIGDGDLDWRALVPHLAGRFTCHLPSMRGRGLSGEHPDLGLERVVADHVAYVDSLDAPAGLVGWSGGANNALAVAARCASVTAVACVEPVANRLFDEQEQGALRGAAARAAQLAGEGDLAAAARAFAAFPFTDGDVAAAEDAGYFEAAGRYVPDVLRFFGQLREHRGPTPDDPAVLGAVEVPVLVLLGSHTKPWAARSARHVVAHVPDGRIEQVAGAGHAAPLTHPEALADALVGFFAPDRQPA